MYHASTESVENIGNFVRFQGDQVPGKNMCSLDARNYFLKPRILKKYSNFLFLMGIFYEFQQIYASKGCNFRQKLGFMMPNIKI